MLLLVVELKEREQTLQLMGGLAPFQDNCPPIEWPKTVSYYTCLQPNQEKMLSVSQHISIEYPSKF